MKGGVDSALVVWSLYQSISLSVRLQFLIEQVGFEEKQGILSYSNRNPVSSLLEQAGDKNLKLSLLRLR